MSERKIGTKFLALASISCLFLWVVVLFLKFGSNLPVSVRAAGTITVASLGDSITNIGATTSTGWLNQYKTDVANRLASSVQVVNLATNGITSQQLLDSVTNDTNYRSQISTAQIVTLEIGYNDFLQNRGKYQDGSCGGVDNQDCLRSMATNFNNNWDSLISQIKSLTANNSSVALRSFDIYYSVAGVDQSQSPPYNGQFSVLNPYLTQMNTHIAQSSSQNGFLMGSVHTAYNGASGAEDPFSKGYILPDGIHPTDLGHTAIANIMIALGYTPLVSANADSDKDGFSDTLENKMGTDPNRACSLPGKVAAWPPDFNNDGGVGVTSDMVALISHAGSKVGEAKYDKRFDLDGDGGIGITTDLLVLLKYIGKSCTPGT